MIVLCLGPMFAARPVATIAEQKSHTQAQSSTGIGVCAACCYVECNNSLQTCKRAECAVLVNFELNDLTRMMQLVEESPGKVQESTAEELLRCLKKLQALKNTSAPPPPAGKAPGSSDQHDQ